MNHSEVIGIVAYPSKWSHLSTFLTSWVNGSTKKGIYEAIVGAQIQLAMAVRTITTEGLGDWTFWSYN